jgi:hypothetical protein
MGGRLNIMGLNMALNTASQQALEYRRERVAQLRLRGLTQRAIVAQLEQEGLVNPETNEPYSLGIVNLDLQVLARQWRGEARKATARHKSQVLAELREVRRAAWDGAGRPAVVDELLKALKDGDAGVRRAAAQALGAVGIPDLVSVLKGLKQESELLGLDAPTKQEIDIDLVKVYEGINPDAV